MKKPQKYWATLWSLAKISSDLLVFFTVRALLTPSSEASHRHWNKCSEPVVPRGQPEVAVAWLVMRLINQTVPVISHAGGFVTSPSNLIWRGPNITIQRWRHQLDASQLGHQSQNNSLKECTMLIGVYKAECISKIGTLLQWSKALAALC